MPGIVKTLKIIAPVMLVAGCLHTADDGMVGQDAAAACAEGTECTDIRPSVGLHRDIGLMGIFRPAPRPMPNPQ